MPRSQISTVPAPYWPAGNLALERRVVERMVLDVDGQVALPGLERDALRDGPARQRAVPLEAEVVVEPARVVALDDEDGLARRAAAAERLGGRALGPLALVLSQARHAGSMPAIGRGYTASAVRLAAGCRRRPGDNPVDAVDCRALDLYSR